MNLKSWLPGVLLSLFGIKQSSHCPSRKPQHILNMTDSLAYLLIVLSVSHLNLAVFPSHSLFDRHFSLYPFYSGLSFQQCGFLALQAYWSFGLTSVVYAVSFTDFGQFHRSRLISPNSRHYLPQMRLFRYVGITSFCYQVILPGKGENPLLLEFSTKYVFPPWWISFVVKHKILHFEGLNPIFYFCHQASDVQRSF